MKKLLSYAIAAAAALFFVSGCAKPGDEFVHDNYTIDAIYITTTLDNTQPQIAGQINQDTGDIYFDIPKKSRKYWYVQGEGACPVHVVATIGYDAKITPPLTRLQTLSESDPLVLTVTATMTGNSRTYNLYIRFLSN